MKMYKSLTNLRIAAIALVVAVTGSIPVNAGMENTWWNVFGNGEMFVNIVNRSKSEAISGVGFGPCAEVAYSQTLFCDDIAGSGYKKTPFRTPTSNFVRGKIGGEDLQLEFSSYTSAGISSDNDNLEFNKFPGIRGRANAFAKVSGSTRSVWSNDYKGKLFLKAKAEGGAVALGVVVWELDCSASGLPTSRADLESRGTKLAEYFAQGEMDNTVDGDCEIVININSTLGKDCVFATFDTFTASTVIEVSPVSDVNACAELLVFPEAFMWGASAEDDIRVRYSVDGVVVDESDIGSGTTLVKLEIGTLGFNEETQMDEFVPLSFAVRGGDGTLVDFLEFAVTKPGFDGFFSPIRGYGGTPDAPVAKVNIKGQGLPVKFDVDCDGAPFDFSPGPIVSVYEVVSYNPETGDEVLSLIDSQEAVRSTTSSSFNTVIDTGVAKLLKIVVENIPGITPFAYVEAR